MDYGRKANERYREGVKKMSDEQRERAARDAANAEPSEREALRAAEEAGKKRAAELEPHLDVLSSDLDGELYHYAVMEAADLLDEGYSHVEALRRGEALARDWDARGRGRH